ncbi:DUF2911 domain-containing protein [Mucilaginibacter sp.]|uniref:DUF2911 domain-containing protein n=1 Tax=Mucilaginibacter sp. TaxID=1882438 RepID=UPI003D0CA925
MKTSFQIKLLSFFLCAFLISSVAMAQKKASGPIPSPRDSVSGVIKGAHIKIWYGSPSVKGRKIFGGLEPYGKVYRAGANEATIFTTDKDITVEGQPLPAGSYAFFVIPVATGKWTVIFNKTAVQWGAFKYDQAQDQLRVMVTPKKVKLTERLVYKITKSGFSMNWDKTSVPVLVK